MNGSSCLRPPGPFGLGDWHTGGLAEIVPDGESWVIENCSAPDGVDLRLCVIFCALDSLSALRCLVCEVVEYVQERLRSRQRWQPNLCPVHFN